MAFHHKNTPGLQYDGTSLYELITSLDNDYAFLILKLG
jgi:hypothetical protein